MIKKPSDNLLAALDVGTNKVVALIGEIKEGEIVSIVGIGLCPSRGLKQGIVVNIDVAMQSMQKAIEAAEIMAGCKIHSVYTGIAGSHIRSLNSQGIVPIRNTEITQKDINQVIEAAKAVAIPNDQRILHILPQEFIVDNQRGIKEPIGMSGVRLEARVHIVSGNVGATQNIVKCVEKCNLQVANIILQPLASSLAVLSDDEKELGVCLIDIGGGTTDIAVFHNGAICHSFVIPIAGDQVTNDIAIAFRIPTKQAENIKIKRACVWKSLLEGETEELENQEIKKPTDITNESLCDVVEARYEELFNLIKYELQRRGITDNIPAGLVLTGGASKMKGLCELAEKVFQLPVRQGSPYNVQGQPGVVNNPIFSTCVGLLLSGHQHQQEGRDDMNFGDSMKGLWDKMRSWFQVNF